jgi:3D (Asp-Asp-Asp) domain-containing protein
VYYSAPDIVNSVQTLQDKLDGITQQDLQSLVSIPGFDQFSDQAAGLLPGNFINTAPDGVRSLLNPTGFKNQLTKGLNNVLPSITDQATSQLEALAGKSFPGVNNLIAGGGFQSLTSQLQKAADSFSTQSAQQMLGVFQNESQGSQFGNISQAVQSGIDKASSLSPKGIRDLKYADKFNQAVGGAVNNSTQNVSKISTQMASSEANNPVFGQTGQAPLQQLSSPKFSGDNKNGFDLAVRLTVYWSQGSGTDADSAAKRSSTGRQLAEGVSVAVDPNIIPYLSRIDIPGVGTRFATDTGGAVKARTASGGRRPIIDVYYEKKEAALAAADRIRSEVTVRVYPPTSKYKYAKNSSPLYGIA